eukprot:2884860-Heterocapsa_arctica.AAC.1
MGRCSEFKNVSQKLFIVLGPRFGDWYYWILDWRLGERPEVHFDWLFTVFGARRASRGPL